jgi:hypothetical protein
MQRLEGSGAAVNAVKLTGGKGIFVHSQPPKVLRGPRDKPMLSILWLFEPKSRWVLSNQKDQGLQARLCQVGTGTDKLYDTNTCNTSPNEQRTVGDYAALVERSCAARVAAVPLLQDCITLRITSHVPPTSHIIKTKQQHCSHTHT